MAGGYVVRSGWRLAFWSLWSAALFVVAFLMVRDGDAPAMILCAGAVAIVVFVWWPRLVVGAEGIEVRNLRTVRLRWRDVKDVTVKRQQPFLGKFWNTIYIPNGIGPRGFPGLVIHARSRTVAVAALQLSPVGERRPSRGAAVANALDVAVGTSRAGEDPVAGFRAALAAR